nr:hypothetical protein Iba_chr08cCG12550 [Ipomoea batatas]
MGQNRRKDITTTRVARDRDHREVSQLSKTPLGAGITFFAALCAKILSLCKPADGCLLELRTSLLRSMVPASKAGGIPTSVSVNATSNAQQKNRCQAQQDVTHFNEYYRERSSDLGTYGAQNHLGKGRNSSPYQYSRTTTRTMGIQMKLNSDLPQTDEHLANRSSSRTMTFSS